MASLEPAKATSGGQAGRTYRLCENYRKEKVCNWAIPAESAETLCDSCRLTGVIPDLGVSGNREKWYRLEVAKRRLIYSLQRLNLPFGSNDDPGWDCDSSSWPTRRTGWHEGPDRSQRTGGSPSTWPRPTTPSARNAVWPCTSRTERSGTLPPRDRPLLLGSLDRRKRLPRVFSRTYLATNDRTMHRPSKALRPGPARRLAGTLMSPPMPARILGRTGPRPGPITCTSPTRWKRRRRADFGFARNAGRTGPEARRRPARGPPRVVRPPDGELVSADLSGEQSQPRPRAAGRLSVRAFAGRDYEIAIRTRDDWPRICLPSRTLLRSHQEPSNLNCLLHHRRPTTMPYSRAQ